MLKLFLCLHRKEGMSMEAFQQYWRERHAPLVRKHAEAIGVKRYIQAHTLATPHNETLRSFRAGPEWFDGVAELWFDEGTEDPASWSDKFQAAVQLLIEDEREFIDLSRSPVFWTVERPIL
jgi:uncharacterized protein (TIGR02118 family)